MKQKMVRVVRSFLPRPLVRGVESVYRKTRIRLVSGLYGNPASDLSVIAITGTNGKTTTASYINEILKQAGLKTAMFSTAQIEIDGQLQANELNVTVASVRRMQQFFKQAKRAKVDYVIIEATSHALDQHKLDGVPIEAAVMTNLTQDHLDYHATMEKYAEAKAKLFEMNPKFMILNRDDEWYEYYAKYQPTGQTITYGTDVDSEARIDYVKLYKKGSEAKVIVDHQTKLDMATALPGKFNVYNMTAAAATGYLLGVKVSDIVEGVANLESIPGRFERVVEGLGYDVIVDYAHTPDALEQLLEAARASTKNRLMLVFGSCGDRDKGKRPIMGGIAARLADRIFLTDEESYNEDPQAIRDQIREGIDAGKGDSKTEEFPDRREAIEKALKVAKKGDSILITGMGHEKYRIVQGEKIPWNDSEVVRQILDELGRTKPKAAAKSVEKEPSTSSRDEADDEVAA
ncbi:MAG: UDP-N-acetylmuramoyl-L-alanyl-D-glutamate--2,6-diaminopimelate ligase [bacterium]|nr:UDP-N-acetylmuramoyl-L-alanyl-D-glutamate--2,6-diaminopimelate ligase [bacterium]